MKGDFPSARMLTHGGSAEPRPSGSGQTRNWDSFLEILRGILDELTDQRAYKCHLAAHGATHSAEEWRKFSDELYRAKSTRARCC